MTTPGRTQNPRFWEQLKVVNDTAPEWIRQAVQGEENVVGAGPLGAREDSDISPDYAYLKQSVLIRDGFTSEVRDAILGDDPHGEDVVPMPIEGDPENTGATRFHIGRRRDVHDTMNRLRSLNDRLVQPAATPDYLIGIAHDDGVGICPAGEPVPAGSMPIPAINATDAGQGVRILVVDTGYLSEVETYHPWLTDAAGDSRVIEPAGGPTPLYYGHGTFITGVLKSVAPGAVVRVSNELSKWAGAETSSRLGGLILEALDRHYPDEWPDIISLSAGTSTLDDNQLIGFRSFFTELGKPEHAHTVLVAAAGNDGRDKPFWPAANAGDYPQPTPGVVSVGALREDGRGRACFSNYGDWVKVFAPGERLVNVFPKGPYKYIHSHLAQCRYYKDEPLYPRCTCISEYQQGEEAYFDGMAQWSGTSFATPIVAGWIAARQARAGGTARQAAEALLSSTLPISDLGALLPEPRPAPEPMPEPEKTRVT